MKKKYLIYVIILFSVISQAQNIEIPAFGTDSTFEAVTWNIEWFPKSGQTTVDYVTEIVLDLDADLLALQEIDDKTYFDQLLENLDGWGGYYVNSEYSNLAYIYNTSVIEVIDFYEIYTSQEYWRPFPRAPMVFELMFMNTKYIVINNHLKCCGDGIMDPDDPWDEETRRRDAMVLLEEFIRIDLQDENVILLGDLNDNLPDPPAHNVFKIFIDNEEDYLFTDMEIANGSTYNWSYPSWPSHLDHILITSELFDEFSQFGSDIQTLRLDDFFEGGFNEYDSKVSDHRPVGLKIRTEEGLAVHEISGNEYEFGNFPNPVQSQTTFSFDPLPIESELSIYNLNGQQVVTIPISINKTIIKWIPEYLPGGVYVAMLKTDKSIVATRKLAVIDR